MALHSASPSGIPAYPRSQCADRRDVGRDAYNDLLSYDGFVMHPSAGSLRFATKHRIVP
ncbi:hypothetical protein [Stenotrophomonas maltophilia]|uniref:hypothetical protein n=1 Tax=Stenotrophomonas maltophilia TaxID=40324 RepID=UPI0015DD0F13|nr:hypothetical protein [Stenotrophomonas maltophilia]EKT4084340.1 hypothetical protein [Stenotrophomonas maltophilia]MCF3479282.1 hypothetical protein [Stenotrophomonas maltophilia]BBQ10797.1 hypothetical protein WP1W18C01_11570 [Stenotrophomonas maltophilia]